MGEGRNHIKTKTARVFEWRLENEMGGLLKGAVQNRISFRSTAYPWESKINLRLKDAVQAKYLVPARSFLHCSA